jgi:hypothetical protein
MIHKLIFMFKCDRSSHSETHNGIEEDVVTMIFRFRIFAELSEQQTADWLLIHNIRILYIWQQRGVT